jgi:hypothetical protein
MFSSGGNRYLQGIDGLGLANSSSSDNGQMVPAMTVTGFKITIANAPAGSTSYTFTLHKEGSTNYAAACTITGTAKTCQWTGTQAIAAGDSVSWEMHRSSSSAAGVGSVAWSLTYAAS